MMNCLKYLAIGFYQNSKLYVFSYLRFIYKYCKFEKKLSRMYDLNVSPKSQTSCATVTPHSRLYYNMSKNLKIVRKVGFEPTDDTTFVPSLVSKTSSFIHSLTTRYISKNNKKTPLLRMGFHV